MATSGSVNFAQNRDEIIKDSMLLLGAIEAGETPSAAEINDGSRALNRLVKMFQADGMHLWSWLEGTLFLTKGTVKYQLGTATGAAHTTDEATKTELSSAAAASATSISVDSITGISNADNIGIEQDDGTLHWTTVSGAPSGTTVTLAAGLASAASVDNHVYAYTDKVDRPLRVTNVRRRDEADNDIPILTFSRQEYFDTPNKTTKSSPTQVYYDPKLGNGVMYLWPAPNTVRDRILFDFARPLEDFDAAANNPDFPVEWLDPLIYGLAVRLAPQYGVPLDQREWLRSEAMRMKDSLLGWDDEMESTYFQPDTGWG